MTAQYGLFYDQPFDDYLKIDAVNNSALKLLSKSPFTLLYASKHPKQATAAMELGSLVHAAVLEAERFDAEYVGGPVGAPRNTKAGKLVWAEFEAQHAGKQIIKNETWQTVLAMRDALMHHPAAHAWLTKEGHSEVTGVWHDAEYDFECKMRADRLMANNMAIIDLKTTTDATEEGFARTCGKFKYHWQAAWYLRGLSVITGSELQPIFVFVVIETTPPYEIGIYQLRDIDLHLGFLEIALQAKRYKTCLDNNAWPMMSTGVVELALPRYFHNDSKVNAQ